MNRWAQFWEDALMSIMDNVFPVLLIGMFVGLIGFCGYMGYSWWEDRKAPPDPWSCIAKHFDHFQSMVVSTGKTTMVTQVPIYACSIKVARQDDYSVILSDGHSQVVLRAPFATQ